METEDIPPPRPPVLQRRHTSDYAGSTPTAGPGATPVNSPASSEGTRPFYRQGAKSNLSGLFGDYVHGIRGRRSGYTTPTDQRRGSPTSRGGNRRRRKRKDAEVFVRPIYF